MRKPKHSVTLTFRSEEQKQYFLGQLSDGLGENHFSLEWPHALDLFDAESVKVTACGELWDHHKKTRRWLKAERAKYERHP